MKVLEMINLHVDSSGGDQELGQAYDSVHLLE